MNLYLADAIQLVHLRYTDRLWGTGVLESYWRLLVNRIKMDKWLGAMGMNQSLDERSNNKLSLFLDSGAFSAWSKGASIDLGEYITFCKKYEPVLSVIAVLDVIPGEKGKPTTSEQRAAAAQRSWDNYQTMLAAGLPKDKLLPCFHCGEDWEWLEKYKEATDYIALGGTVKVTNRVEWFEQAWAVLTDRSGMPTHKIHGFGMTSFDLMRRYPWYSVDSTTWVMMSRFGSILVPVYRDGKWIYSEDPWKVTVSEKSPSTADAGKHFDSWPILVQAEIRKYVEAKGFSLEAARTDYMVRDQLNIIYFKDFEASRPAWPWAYNKVGARQEFF